MADDRAKLMDVLFIKNLSAFATIGVHDYERNIKQEVKINMEISFNNKIASATDDITDALDYEAISKRALQYVEGSQHFLIETVAESLSELLLKEFPIDKLTLAISKPGAIKSASDVGVKVVRP